MKRTCIETWSKLNRTCVETWSKVNRRSIEIESDMQRKKVESSKQQLWKTKKENQPQHCFITNLAGTSRWSAVISPASFQCLRWCKTECAACTPCWNCGIHRVPRCLHTHTHTHTHTPLESSSPTPNGLDPVAAPVPSAESATTPKVHSQAVGPSHPLEHSLPNPHRPGRWKHHGKPV